jgi:hypothetical protein
MIIIIYVAADWMDGCPKTSSFTHEAHPIIARVITHFYFWMETPQNINQ